MGGLLETLQPSSTMPRLHLLGVTLRTINDPVPGRSFTTLRSVGGTSTAVTDRHASDGSEKNRERPPSPAPGPSRLADDNVVPEPPEDHFTFSMSGNRQLLS